MRKQAFVVSLVLLVLMLLVKTVGHADDPDAWVEYSNGFWSMWHPADWTITIEEVDAIEFRSPYYYDEWGVLIPVFFARITYYDVAYRQSISSNTILGRGEYVRNCMNGTYFYEMESDCCGGHYYYYTIRVEAFEGKVVYLDWDAHRSITEADKDVLARVLFSNSKVARDCPFQYYLPVIRAIVHPPTPTPTITPTITPTPTGDKPDLVIRDFEVVDGDHDDVNVDEVITIRIRIKNQGSVEAKNIVTRWWPFGEDEDTSLDFTVDSLDLGQDHDQRWENVKYDTAGEYPSFVMVDYNNKVDESDEDNNTASLIITVTE